MSIVKAIIIKKQIRRPDEDKSLPTPHTMIGMVRHVLKKGLI